MSRVTRTIGPIHLEDIEPHRFEDLIRQLVYDFRDWRQLEATGRAGSDDGYDVRGWEVIKEENPVPDEDELALHEKDRLWLIQCKREKAIGPTKLIKYVSEIPDEERDRIHGIVMAAACDFSKRSRDAYREKCIEYGFQEWYLWGKAEIEDMLFQPKNDHLLFAYIGISIQKRRRSLKTEIRARLATKRELAKKVQNHTNVLLRDVSDERYPYQDDDTNKKWFERRRWRLYESKNICDQGLTIAIARYHAYVNNEKNEWDYSETDNLARPHYDPWCDDEDERSRVIDNSSNAIWQQLPEENRAFYELDGVLGFDDILAIDEIGDEDSESTDSPTIYTTPWDIAYGPFMEEYAYVEMSGVGGRYGKYVDTSSMKRVRKFPR